MSEVSINLNTLAAKQQSIVGIPRGTPEQLRELVEAVADERVNIRSYFTLNQFCTSFQLKTEIKKL